LGNGPVTAIVSASAPADPQGNAATASEPLPFTPDHGARQQAIRILQSPEFGHRREGWRIRYSGPRWWEQEPATKKQWAWLEEAAKAIAEVLRVLAWLGVAAVVAGLLYLLARYLNVNGWRREGTVLPPDILFGLDVRPASLPDDLPAAARILLARGELRAAVGLLYRGTLVGLIVDGRIDIRRGDTESECLQRVHSAYALDAAERAKAAYFAALVGLWERVAYANDPAAPAGVENLVAGWEQHFRLALDRRRSRTGDVAEVAI
jgi:hypothetical protein